MRHIQQCNIAHFACHGVSNPTNPSQSGLLLQTVTLEPRQDILSVREVCESHHAQGEIAYLSACSTAENRAIKLMDEVLHVVSGFQVAGFRHVIGCLWPSDDNVCVEVAKLFYSELNRNATLESSGRAVALALHKAIVEVSKSDQYRKRPLHWAQYVHYGA
jgi:CHAT domain-containing protein